jgi:ATP-dependent DNA helicase PIF1
MFCFESPNWNLTFPNQIELIKIFRQKDPLYAKILNQIRKGKISKSSLDILEPYVGRINKDSEIMPTILYPTRHRVDKINTNAMKQITDDAFVFEIKRCSDSELDLSAEEKILVKSISPSQIEHEFSFLISNINCENRLELKKGAQVMCIANLDVESEFPICNGSQGIITEFTAKGDPIVKFKNGITRTIGHHIWKSENIPCVGIKQIPLILAWAITIHKSQGATLDCAEIDIGSGIFECGQTYVALSRIISLEGLYLKSFDYTKIKINKKVSRFYEGLSNNI